MADNPFLPLSFIAGPAVLTNASTVLLNGASIRYNLAIGLWRDLQSELRGEHTGSTAAYGDYGLALRLAQRRVVLIVRALTLLYGAVGGFGLSTLTGLVGALLVDTADGAAAVAKLATVAAGIFGLVCLLGAAFVFTLESRCTLGLLRLGTAEIRGASRATERVGEGA